MKVRIATLLLAFAALTATALSQVVPPTKAVYGKSLDQWMTEYFMWNTESGQTLPFQPGPDPIVFMPIPWGTGEYTIPVGTSFVVPMFAWVIERYKGYPKVADDGWIPEDFWRSTVYCPGKPNQVPEVTLDGERILANFWNYYCPGTYFPEPIPYDPWHNYGGGTFATHALGVQGVGFVCGPLSVGKHTLTLNEELSAFGVVFQNTWIINVK